MKIGRFIDLLAGAGLETSLIELREMLWLAGHITPAPADSVAPRAFAHGGLAAVAPPPPPAAPRPATAPARLLPSAEEPDGTERLYASTGKHAGAGARLVRVRGTPALPQALAISRALRPLSRRRNGEQLVLDEGATAESIAATGTRSVVMRHAQERWFDIVILTENVPTLAAWAPVVAEFNQLMVRQGGFRSVRALQFAAISDGFVLREANGAAVAPASLHDRLGRRILLVASDCTSTVWRNGAAGHWLNNLAGEFPLAVVQLLPQALWPNTAIGFAELRTRSGRLALPTSRLQVKRPSWAVDEPGVVVPVFSLNPEMAGQWARMTAGGGKTWATAALLPLEGEASIAGTEGGVPDAALRAARFRASATRDAQRLAAYFSVVRPLTAPVMRIIHRALEPDSGAVALAQVLLGDLLSQVGSAGEYQDPEQVEYDFYPGLRDQLSQALTAHQFIKVNLALHDFLEQSAGTSFDFFALLADAGGNERLPPAALPFAQFARAAARRFIPGAPGQSGATGGLATLTITGPGKVLTFEYRSARHTLTMRTDINTFQPRLEHVLARGAAASRDEVERLLVPPGFIDAAAIVTDTDFIELRLDADTAGFPWERMLVSAAPGRIPLAAARGLTRRNLSSHLSLQARPLAPGAIVFRGTPPMEAASIASLMRTRHGGRISLVEDVGSNSAWANAGGHPAGIIHIAAGTPVEVMESLNRLESVPEVIFLGISADIAQVHSLIGRGAQAVVAAAHPVVAEDVALFANDFYERLFDGSPLIHAVREARLTCLRQKPNADAWGRFQCFGDPYWRVDSVAPVKETEISDSVLQVCVLYAHEDSADGWVETFAGDLGSLLANAGTGTRYQIIDGHGDRADSTFSGDVSQRLDSCAAVVVVMSAQFKRSDSCQKELAYYVDRSPELLHDRAIFIAEIEPGPKLAPNVMSHVKAWATFWEPQRHKIRPLSGQYEVTDDHDDVRYWLGLNVLVKEILSATGGTPAAPPAGHPSRSAAQDELEVISGAFQEQANRQETPVKEAVSEVDLTRILQTLVDSGAVPNLRDDVEAELISAVDGADWIVEADSYLTVEPDGEHGELISWDFHSPDNLFRPSGYENGILVVKCRLNAFIRVHCSFSFSVKDHIDKDMVSMGHSSASREIRFRFDAEIAFGGIEDRHPELDWVEIEHIAERVDFGNVDPDWGDDGSEVTNDSFDTPQEETSAQVDKENRAEDFIKNAVRTMTVEQIHDLADHNSETSRMLRDSYFEKFPLNVINDIDVHLQKSRFQHTATDLAKQIENGNVERGVADGASGVTDDSFDTAQEETSAQGDEEKRAEDFVKAAIRSMTVEQIRDLADHESETSRMLRDSYFEKYPLGFVNDRDVYIHKSRFQHTATDLAKQLESDPLSRDNLMGKTTNAAYERGLKNFAANRFEDAIYDFTAALAIDDARPDLRAAAQYNRALAHTSLGNIRAATDDYDAVIMSPNVPAEMAKAAADNRKKLTSRRGPMP